MMNCFRDNSWEETELTHTAIDKAQCVQTFVPELNPDTNTNTYELPISSSRLLDDNLDLGFTTRPLVEFQSIWTCLKALNPH